MHTEMERETKRMRKGTKSCLPCRERKIRCSRLNELEESCVECRVRGTKCISQGIVVERPSKRKATYRSSRSASHTRSDDSNISQTCYEALQALKFRLNGSLLDNEDSPVGSRTTEDVKTVSTPLLKLFDESDRPSSTSSSKGSGLSPKHHLLARQFCDSMPSEDEMKAVFASSSWWALYRDNLGMLWSQTEDLESFVLRTFQDGNPCMLALVLVCFSIGTGERRFVEPIEHLDDDLASTEPGLNCLIGLGLSYLTLLQPRRAWMVYRRANTLLQLSGIHRKKRSQREDAVFWTLFHADRWVSLMIGLPYSIIEQHCDLTLDLTGPTHAWLYRKLAMMTTKVIDCLHTASFANSLIVEQEIGDLQNLLPENYLDIDDAGTDVTRLYRILHFYQLIATVHLPFFLQHKHEYSEEACIKNARLVVKAYLRVYEADPMVCYNGTVLNFNAFVASVILLLGSLSRWDQGDWNMLQKVLEALNLGKQVRIAHQICEKCAVALAGLLELDPEKVVEVPYFGSVRMKRRSPSVDRVVQAAPPPGTMPPANPQVPQQVPPQAPGVVGYPPISAAQALQFDLNWSAPQPVPAFDCFQDDTNWVMTGDQLDSAMWDNAWFIPQL